MKTRRKFGSRGLIAAAALLLLLGFCTLIGCSENEDPHQKPDSDLETPDQVLFEAKIVDTEGGERRWVLISDRLEKNLDSYEAELFGVTMNFFKADTLFSTLTSQRGRANMKKKDLFAWGEVVVLTQDGRRLETEEIMYDNTTGLITNEVFNRFTEDRDVMTGFGMEATPELDSFILKREVQAEVHSESDEERR